MAHEFFPDDIAPGEPLSLALAERICIVGARHANGTTSEGDPSGNHSARLLKRLAAKLSGVESRFGPNFDVTDLARLEPAPRRDGE